MKVLAVNSSPRVGTVSKTEMMLDRLVAGLREGGAEVEVVNLHKKKINYCVGCFTCWTKTPGSCAQKDDMTEELFPKYIESDLCVLATPLYHYTVNAQMKAFIERTLPVLEPFFVEREGVTTHPFRNSLPGTVILSGAAFPEPSVFDHMRSYVQFLFRDWLVAEIYRPSSESLSRGGSNAVVTDVFDALEQGGRELAKSKCISPETLGRIEQPLETFESMAPLTNLVWRTCINNGVTLGEFRKKRMRLRPDSVDSFLGLLAYGFKAKAAEDVSATIQYKFSEEVEGVCYVSVQDGVLDTGIGGLDEPDVTIEVPFEVWMDVLEGKSKVEELVADGRVRIEGDWSVLGQLKKAFRH